MRNLDFTGYKGYTITEGGVVYTSNLVEVKKVLSNNKSCVKVELSDGYSKRDFNVAGLMMMAYELPMESKKGFIDYNKYWSMKWRLTYIDRDVTNCNIHNLKVVDEKATEIIPSTFNSKGLAREILSNNYDDTILDDTEAFAYVYNAVNFHLAKGQFPSLNGDIDTVDDLINDVYLVLYRRGLFRKFDSKKAKKHTYVFNAVKNNLVDRLRTLKETLSLDESTETGGSIIDVIEDTEDVYNDLISNETVLAMINSLSNSGDNFLYANSPAIGTCKLTMRTVAIHLFLGYTNIEIAKMFDVAPKTISRMKREIKESLEEYKYLLVV